MKHKFSIFLLIFLVLVILLPISKAWAASEFSILNVEISDITDGTAKLKWSTPWDQSRAMVYFGLDANNLDKSTGYNVLSLYHESALTGLEIDKTYYYKIVATNSNGENVESFVRQFSTKGMKDTVKPKISNVKALQIIDKAAAISWEASEKTAATISYGKFVNNETPVKYKAAASAGNSLGGEKFISGLSPSTEYQIKVVIKDKAKNQAEAYLKIKTETSSDSYKKLSITNIKPSDTGSSEVSAKKASVSWQTNMISSGIVYYGTKSNQLKSKAIIDVDVRKRDHKATLIGLTPKTTYYFRIEAYSSFNSGSVKTEILSFTTKAESVAGDAEVDVVNPDIDTDGDSLSDAYELQIGTNPKSTDTDKDGFSDDLEIWFGYNPNGAGKLSAERYFKPRLNSTTEQTKAKELRKLLEDEFGKLTLDAKYWPGLVSAYIYGDYPIQAIIQTIKFGGKTVHPTIMWEDWKNTETYFEYIDK
ncbi:MAG: fibronectin type III domain-containing protein [Patescibacteria group bacterium]